MTFLKVDSFYLSIFPSSKLSEETNVVYSSKKRRIAYLLKLVYMEDGKTILV
jgi:hypothetical protein